MPREEVEPLLKKWEREDMPFNPLAGVYKSVYNKWEQNQVPEKRQEAEADRAKGIVVKEAVVEMQMAKEKEAREAADLEAARRAQVEANFGKRGLDLYEKTTKAAKSKKKN